MSRYVHARPEPTNRHQHVTYVAVESRYGRLFVAASPAGVVLARRADTEAAFEREAAVELGRNVVATSDPARAAMVGRWLDGDPPSQPPFDLGALPRFAQAALRKTSEIPFGEVRPYGWIAKEIGRPEAARAVGTALGRNPIDLLIPCHRVVSGNGSLGPYGRSGQRTKRALLACEGVDVERLDVYARSGIRFLGDASTMVVCYPTCRRAREARERDLAAFGAVQRALGEGFVVCERCRPAATGRRRPRV